MGGKKERESQRKKGNTKASSSARSAQLLSNSASGGFVGFSSTSSGFSVPLTGIADNASATEFVDDAAVPTEFRVVLRKMMKKDTVTKLKVGVVIHNLTC